MGLNELADRRSVFEKFAVSVQSMIDSHTKCSDALRQSQCSTGEDGKVGETLRKVALDDRKGAQPYVTLLPTVQQVIMATERKSQPLKKTLHAAATQAEGQSYSALLVAPIQVKDQTAFESTVFLFTASSSQFLRLCV